MIPPLAIFSLMTALLCAGCRRTEPPAAVTAEDGSVFVPNDLSLTDGFEDKPTIADVAGAQSASVTPTADSTGDRGQASEAAQFSPVAPDDLRETLFGSATPTDRRRPVDTEIGPLMVSATVTAQTSDAAGIGPAAARVVAGLSRRVVDATYTSAAARAALSRTLAAADLAPVARAVRLGGIRRVGEGTAAVRFRAFRAVDSIHGEVFLVRDNDRWLVDDVTGNLNAPAVAMRSAVMRFEPSAGNGRWGLQ